MLAPVAVGPAVEGTALHRCHVVGDQVGAKLVALVDDGPQRVGATIEGEAIRIAQPIGEDLEGARCRIDFPDRGTHALCSDSAFHYVAVRSNPDVELRSISARR